MRCDVETGRAVEEQPIRFWMTAERIVLGGYMIGDIAYVVFHIQSVA